MSGVEPLCAQERETISRELTRKRSARYIRKLLGRHHSTITREIERNGGANLHTEPVGFQISDQRIEPTPRLAGIPRRADRLIPIGVRTQHPALLTSHPDMVRVLLLQRPGSPGPIQAQPQVVPGTLDPFTLLIATRGSPCDKRYL
ncbi:MAG: helix-turn-helix domain-containing protein [Pseudonocardiaceae bacterium]